MRKDDYGYDYDEYDSDEATRWWPRVMTIIVAVAALAAVAVVIIRWMGSDGDGSTRFASGTPSIVTQRANSGTPAGSTPIDPASESIAPRVRVLPPELPTTSDDGRTAGTASGASTATTTSTSQSASASTTSTTVDPESAVSSVAAAAAPAGQAGPTPTVPPGTPYPTEPDGSPRPVVAIFDTTTITLTGEVPSQAAADRLAALSVANSQTPATVVNNLIINPSVPLGVGVRVIELNSPRFPERSSTILPAHAAELDRVAAVMNALPNVTVLVVGHADQRGTEVGNFAISDERARAVVNYLVYVGIAPARLSARAVGDQDLLAAGDDATSLALNRRTEFIFYGLLIE